MVVERKLIRAVRTISPFDFTQQTHSPLQDAEYVVEIRKCSRPELVGTTLHRASMARESSGIEGTSTGWLEEREVCQDHNPEVDTDQYAIGLENDAQGFYDCRIFMGTVSGEFSRSSVLK